MLINIILFIKIVYKNVIRSRYRFCAPRTSGVRETCLKIEHESALRGDTVTIDRLANEPARNGEREGNPVIINGR